MFPIPARIRQYLHLRPGWPSWALLLSLTAIGAATLVPDPSLVELAAATPVWCLVCGSMGTIDVIWNVLLFVPLGAAARWNGWSASKIILCGVAVSLTIETTQGLFLPGRDASLSDLLTNTCGTILGRFLVDWLPPAIRPTAKMSRRLMVTGMIAWLTVTGAVAWGVAPQVSNRPYFGQWAPAFRHLGVFRGDILVATVAGVPLPRGPFLETRPVRDRLGHADTLWARIRTAAATDDPSPIVSLADDAPTTLLRLSQDGRHLVFHSHTRLGLLKLREPAIVLHNAFPPTAGEEVEIGGASTSTSLAVWRVDASGRLGTTVRKSPHWFWYAVFPVDITLGRTTPIWTALWLCLLMTALAFWTARAASARPAFVSWAVLVTVLLIGMVGVPLAAGLDPASPLEWAGVVAGCGAGTLLSRLRVLAPAMERDPNGAVQNGVISPVR